MKFVKPDMNPEYVTESREALWDLLAIKGRKPATVQTWVNRDGTNGAVKVIIGTLNGGVQDITWHVARVLNSRVKNGGVEVSGAQVNRHVQLMHALWRELKIDSIPPVHELSGV